MMDRIIFLGTQVDDYTANTLQAQLLYLDSVDPGKDISIYINSPGGSVYAGLGIYDTMQFISSDVATICTGMAASMAAVLLVAGADKAIPLTDEEIAALGVEKREVVVGYQVGDNVKITDGALESFLGTVDEIDIPARKVRVRITMFGRELPAELELHQVKLF
jgi:hypothetical protein